MHFKKILDLTRTETVKFLNSFDNVLFDFDGVICVFQELIPGANDAVNKLRSMGKTIRFVTNNSFFGFNEFLQTFKRLKIQVEEHEILNQTKSVSSYLKSINFDKELLAICSESAIDYYKCKGIKVYDMPHVCKVTMENITKEKFRKEIGAVLFDLSFDFTYEKLCRAQLVLSRPDVLFLVGAYDNSLAITHDITIMAPKFFVDAAISVTGREPLFFAKPSEQMKKFVFKNFDIKDPRRTLFIGDSLAIDMRFASLCGFQKLLVLSGVTKKESLLKNCIKDSYPDYVADSLMDVVTLLDNLDSKIKKII